MTATCTLCGTPFHSFPDLSILNEEHRAQKEFADIGRLAGEHLSKIHRKTVQTRFPEPDLVGPIPIPAMILAAGVCAQNSAVNAYLKCEDAVFWELNEKMVSIVRRALEPVQGSIVVPSVVG